MAITDVLLEPSFAEFEKKGCAEMVAAEDDSNGDEPPLPNFSEEEFVVCDKYSFTDTRSALIGQGSYGVVFKGVKLGTNQPVAIKRLAKVSIKESELSLIKSLKSDYLVGVLDICDLNISTSCVVMELLDTDLDNHLHNRAPEGRLSNKNLNLIIDNLARGYKALNELRIVHRDIKPQNVLVSYRTEMCKEFVSAKITDFGVARTLGEDALSNVAGTLYYMAPEVGANLLKLCQYKSEVDMWSIGCLIFQCLTGDVPFDEPSLCRLFLYMACHNYEAYDFPELPPETPNNLASLIYSLLEIDPERRATPSSFLASATAMTFPLDSPIEA